MNKNTRNAKQPSRNAPAGNFWRAMSFEELAVAQGVTPLTDVDALIGIWPSEVGDGFEAAVRRLRHPRERAD
ncbi:MAG: hypothetical protein WD823_13840 [Sulfuricaulis sp.]|uniref:hypothetical protein n=1 Tax=Sulfuricaulis sp. TaxID=2003553 RepID=UPI0034A327AB